MEKPKKLVTFIGLELKCPGCGGSTWMVTRAGTRILCRECYREYKLVEVPKT